MIDLHVHILPGLDVGNDLDGEALAMCHLAAEDGTTLVVATPHMFNGIYHVRREQILNGVRRLQEAINAEKIPLKVLPGADVHADADLARLTRAGEVMTVADGGRYLMVELSHDVIPPQTRDMLFSLQLLGITPIVTHPERSMEVQEDPSLLLPLLSAGNIAQVTAASLVGTFGGATERCAKELIQRGFVHLVASDAHSSGRRSPGLSQAREVVEGLVGNAVADEIFVVRPEKIIAGEYVTLPDPVEETASKSRRTWAWWKR